MIRFKRNEAGGFFSNSLIQLLLILWAIFQLYPIFWLISSSFKPSDDIKTRIFALPNSFYFENYDFPLFSERGITIGIYFRNSVVITIISLIVLTTISLIAGYGIAKLRFPGKNIILILFVAILGVPIHSLLIPLYGFISRLGLLNSYFGLILPYVAFNAPFSVLLLQTYFRQFPNEIIEAAKIDGCSNTRVFTSIVMPVSLGAISTVLIINFINIWNEFLFSLVIMRNNAAKTLPVGLMSFKGHYTVDWGPLLAAMVIVVIPTIVFYLIFHRNIIKGMTAGSIKG